ncbi:MAG: UDP-forming cellulose synthase catalytic subunit [Pseudomonadota bacterium]
MASSIRWAMIVLSILGLLILVTFPVSSQAQMVLSAGAILGMLVFWPLRRHRFTRYIFLALGSVIVMRYLFWRSSQTLPAMGDIADFSAGLVLLLAEIFCITLFFINLFIVVDPIKRADAPLLSEEALPSVDVFVPSYNEDGALLASTLSAAKALDYPAHKLNVYLLDDGGTDEQCSQSDLQKAADAQNRRRELTQLCAQLNVHYVARERNVHAKAGNLNAGMAVSTSDLIVVFDADHAPVREFLRETVGYFAKDAKLFLVQTPHVFLNPDPVEKNLGTWSHMPSENEQFYSVVQCGLDRWNAAFFCGSAAVLRRQALDEVGGFSGITITEDCETALELHAKGWHSLYVDKPLIGGLQPESFGDFIGQRSRWCRGMMQILILKNPLLKKGLSLPQRVGYLSSSLFWAFPFPRLIFTIAPLFFIFFEMRIYVATTFDFFAYTINYLLVALMLQNYLFSRVRWPWVSELYEFLQSPFLARAILSVVKNPRKPTFNVTAKNTTLTEDHFSSFATPFVVMFGVLLAAMALVIFQIMDDTTNNDLLYVVASWNAFNLTLAGVALGAITERRTLRRTHRISSVHKAILTVGSRHVPVNIHDVSIGGLSMTPIGTQRLGLHSSNQLGTISFIRTPVAGMSINEAKKPAVERLSVVLRRVDNGPDGVEVGAEFVGLESPHFISIAYLMYGSAEPLKAFLQQRRNGKNIFGGTFNLMRWSLREPARAVRLFLQLRLTKRDSAKQAANTGADHRQTAPQRTGTVGAYAASPFAELSEKLGLREVPATDDASARRHSTSDDDLAQLLGDPSPEPDLA